MYRRIFLCLVLSLIVLTSLGVAPRYSFGAQQAGGSTGVLVPLYSYPGQSWQSLIQAKEVYPSVPVVAIINPSNGPGNYQDPNYVSGIQQLESAGITVVGYVATGYGSVPILQAEQEISTYSQFYKLDGIFFDEMASVPGFESYYSTLSSYATSLGYTLTVGNPGASVPMSYIGTVSNIVIYENSGLPSTSFLSSLGYQPSDFSVISYGVSGVNATFVQSASADVAYIYLTDQSLPNPYATLPSDFNTLMATLSETEAGSTMVPITIVSVDLSGNPVLGLWTAVEEGKDNSVASGFTPEVFYALPGEQYQVTAANYGNYVFDYWGDGSTSSTQNVTVSGPTTLVAYYQTVNSTATVTVDSFDTYGNQIPGLWTTIQSSGQVVASGYTPFSFQASTSSSYTVTIYSYGSYNFESWSTGSYSPSISITPTSSEELAAFYST